MPSTIGFLTGTVSPADLADLAALLRDAVAGGASIGFLAPVSDAEVADFWAGVLGEVAADDRVLVVAREGGRIIGSVQLELARRTNSRHRAELQKLLVLRTHRGRGLGGALMQAAEAGALQRGRTLIVLDTSASGNAVGLYVRSGYTRAGVIPRYATDPDGSLIDTVIFYKEFSP